jgi:thiamine pyrophosphokinase
MNRCIIICGYINGAIRRAVTLDDSDYIICADAGLDLALQENIRPHLHIGDGDSGHADFDGRQIKLPVRKDDTDLMAAVKYAVAVGFRDLWIVGGIGGRFDHSIASVQTLAYALAQGVSARLVDEDTEILLCRDRITLPRREGFTLSIFAYGGRCEGVSLFGTSFPLQNGTLTPGFPLGVSNEIVDETAVIEVKLGKLLIICSRNNEK